MYFFGDYSECRETNTSEVSREDRIKLNSLNANLSQLKVFFNFQCLHPILNCIYARKQGTLYPNWSFCIAFTEYWGGGGESWIYVGFVKIR